MSEVWLLNENVHGHGSQSLGICLLSNFLRCKHSGFVFSSPPSSPIHTPVPLPRSPHHDIKVMSVGSLQEKADSAIVWRGPRKTALIKRFLKDTFWGRLDYLIFDILIILEFASFRGHPPVSVIPRPSLSQRHSQAIPQSASFSESSSFLDQPPVSVNPRPSPSQRHSQATPQSASFPGHPTVSIILRPTPSQPHSQAIPQSASFSDQPPGALWYC